MTKQKWNFAAIVGGKNHIMDTNELWDGEIEIDIKLCACDNMFGHNQDYQYHNSINCFIEALKENKHDVVELYGLRLEHIIVILPYLKDVKYLSLFKCNRLESLSFIEELTELRGIYIYWNQKATKLFNARKLNNLTMLSIVDANKLTDFSGLEGSNIEKFKIWGCNFLSSFTPKVVISDFEIFVKMPKLISIDIFPVKNENSRTDLIALSKLTKLEKLLINKKYFTFEQFAWLKSKLPHTTGIEPLHEWGCYQDETLWTVIGSNKPTIKKREIADKYERQYYALVEKYQNRENPPMDDEKE